MASRSGSILHLATRQQTALPRPSCTAEQVYWGREVDVAE